MAIQIANRVRTERRKRGWSQDDLADRSGLPQPSISQYERGVMPSPDNIDRIAGAFNVEPATVFSWLREPVTDDAA
jgi:transcriptional regulator with XRE-family HTH domain